MKLLLDTHVLAWLVSDRAQLKARERTAIERHGRTMLVSTVSLWELRLKWRSNSKAAGADGLITPNDALRFCRRLSLEVVPLTVEDVTTTLDTPVPHRDPFDEILLIQAQRLDARLLTRDGALAAHPLAYTE